jgi:hypothetical protein
MSDSPSFGGGYKQLEIGCETEREYTYAVAQTEVMVYVDAAHQPVVEHANVGVPCGDVGRAAEETGAKKVGKWAPATPGRRMAHDQMETCGRTEVTVCVDAEGGSRPLLWAGALRTIKNSLRTHLFVPWIAHPNLSRVAS